MCTPRSPRDDGGVRRVAIIGCGGAGKSTLAQALGACLGIEVVHLDRLYWRPGWVPTPRALLPRRPGRRAADGDSRRDPVRRPVVAGGGRRRRRRAP
jgi:hypothetical protein